MPRDHKKLLELGELVQSWALKTTRMRTPPTHLKVDSTGALNLTMGSLSLELNSPNSRHACLTQRLENLLLLLQNHLRDIVLQLLTVSSFGYRASGWCLGYYSRFHKNRNDLKITRLGWEPVSIV